MKMELWIRSQDKEDLIKVDNLGLAYLGKYNFVDKIGDIHREEYHICQFEENCHTTLGYYKTKERAIEVLDEIQNILIGKYMISLDYKNALGSNFTSKQIQEVLKETSVYQMPDK